MILLPPNVGSTIGVLNHPPDLGGAALAGLIPTHGPNGAVNRRDGMSDAIKDTFTHIGTDRSIGELLNRH